MFSELCDFLLLLLRFSLLLLLWCFVLFHKYSKTIVSTNLKPYEIKDYYGPMLSVSRPSLPFPLPFVILRMLKVPSEAKAGRRVEGEE